MGAWIEASFLQLIGLGTQGDPYLRDGRHLRWFMHRELGFPQSGFRLTRRPALVPWNEKTVLRLGVAREQNLTEVEVGAAAPSPDGALRFPNGLTVRKATPLGFVTPPPFGLPFLRLDGAPLTLRFGPKDPVPTAGPDLHDPAAYVLLTVIRRERTGAVRATAYAASDEGRHFVDEGATGSRLRAIFPGLTAIDPRHLRLHTSAERGVPPEALDRRNVERLRELSRRLGRPMRGRVPPPRRPTRPAPKWTLDTLLLHGGLIDEVEITGHDVVLAAVTWIPTRDYAELEGWEEVDQFHLPLTDHGPFYPEWSPRPGSQIAADRLQHAPPRALPPWDLPTHPPPPDAAGVALDQQRRYLGPAFAPLDDALRELTAREIAELRPQFDIGTPSPTTSIDQDGVGAGELVERPFDAVYGASVDPQMARVLGLMTTDPVSPGPSAFDYVVRASFPMLWMQRLVMGPTADDQLETLRTQLRVRHGLSEGAPFAPHHVAPWLRGMPVLSMATGIGAEATPLPLAPEDLGVTVRAEPSMRPLQSEVTLSWAVSSDSFFRSPRNAKVFYALRRAGADGDVVSNREEEGLRTPIVPTRQAEDGGRARWVDRRLTAYGEYEWRLSGMDPFGRWSGWSTARAEVRYRLAPMSPAVVSASLEGDLTAAPTWTALELVFDWTDALREDASDLDHFEIHVRQGDVRPVDAEDPSSWGSVERAPGTHVGTVRVPWPLGPAALAPAALTASVSSEALPNDQGGGHRVRVALGPIVKPFDDQGFAKVSATVTAVDQAGNASGPGRRALATRVDPFVPPPPPLPPGPQHSSRPDARARSFYRLAFEVPAGTRAQVLRAPHIALLQAAGTSSAVWEAMSEGERVDHLKKLALTHRAGFRPAHELPLDDRTTEYRLELNGNDRGWTVVTVSRLGRTGTRTAWPTDTDRFAVVAVPRFVRPNKPVVDEARPSDRTVSLRVLPDPSGRTRALRVYRTRHAERLEDLRRMRPIATVDVAASRLDEEVAPIVVMDTSPTEWRTYGYRVVAVGDGGVRSEPTAPIFARPWSSEPPEPPEVLSVVRTDLAGERRTVTWRAPRDDYGFELLRRPDGALAWQAPEPVDLAGLTPHSTPSGFEFTWEDVVPEPQRHLEFAYRVRVRDPGGQLSDSAPRRETP